MRTRTPNALGPVHLKTSAHTLSPRPTPSSSNQGEFFPVQLLQPCVVSAIAPPRSVQVSRGVASQPAAAAAAAAAWSSSTASSTAALEHIADHPASVGPPEPPQFWWVSAKDDRQLLSPNDASTARGKDVDATSTALASCTRQLPSTQQVSNTHRRRDLEASWWSITTDGESEDIEADSLPGVTARPSRLPRLIDEQRLPGSRDSSPENWAFRGDLDDLLRNDAERWHAQQGLAADCKSTISGHSLDHFESETDRTCSENASSGYPDLTHSQRSHEALSDLAESIATTNRVSPLTLPPTGDDVLAVNAKSPSHSSLLEGVESLRGSQMSDSSWSPYVERGSEGDSQKHADAKTAATKISEPVERRWLDPLDGDGKCVERQRGSDVDNITHSGSNSTYSDAPEDEHRSASRPSWAEDARRSFDLGIMPVAREGSPLMPALAGGPTIGSDMLSSRRNFCSHGPQDRQQHLIHCCTYGPNRPPPDDRGFHEMCWHAAVEAVPVEDNSDMVTQWARHANPYVNTGREEELHEDRCTTPRSRRPNPGSGSERVLPVERDKAEESAERRRHASISFDNTATRGASLLREVESKTQVRSKLSSLLPRLHSTPSNSSRRIPTLKKRFGTTSKSSSPSTSAESAGSSPDSLQSSASEQSATSAHASARYSTASSSSSTPLTSTFAMHKGVIRPIATGWSLPWAPYIETLDPDEVTRAAEFKSWSGRASAGNRSTSTTSLATTRTGEPAKIKRKWYESKDYVPPDQPSSAATMITERRSKGATGSNSPIRHSSQAASHINIHKLSPSTTLVTQTSKDFMSPALMNARPSLEIPDDSSRTATPTPASPHLSRKKEQLSSLGSYATAITGHDTATVDRRGGACVLFCETQAQSWQPPSFTFDGQMSQKIETVIALQPRGHLVVDSHYDGEKRKALLAPAQNAPVVQRMTVATAHGTSHAEDSQSGVAFNDLRQQTGVLSRSPVRSADQSVFSDYDAVRRGGDTSTARLATADTSTPISSPDLSTRPAEEGESKPGKVGRCLPLAIRRQETGATKLYEGDGDEDSGSDSDSDDDDEIFSQPLLIGSSGGTYGAFYAHTGKKAMSIVVEEDEPVSDAASVQTNVTHMTRASVNSSRSI